MCVCQEVFVYRAAATLARAALTGWLRWSRQHRKHEHKHEDVSVLAQNRLTLQWKRGSSSSSFFFLYAQGLATKTALRETNCGNRLNLVKMPWRSGSSLNRRVEGAKRSKATCDQLNTYQWRTSGQRWCAEIARIWQCSCLLIIAGKMQAMSSGVSHIVPADSQRSFLRIICSVRGW